MGLRSKRNAMPWQAAPLPPAEDAGEEKCNKWRAGSTIIDEAAGRWQKMVREAGRRRHSMQSTAYSRRRLRVLVQPVRKC